MNGYWHDTNVRLSASRFLMVCTVQCGKTTQPRASVSEQMNTKSPLETQFYNFQPATVVNRPG